MKHYSEEDLILHYYGDGGGQSLPGAGRRSRAIAEHVDQCADCAARYRELAGTLNLLEESVAACMTAVTPWERASRTMERSAMSPVTSVNGDGLMSRPVTSSPWSRSTRTSASPRWPELPVTRIFSSLFTLISVRDARRS